MVDGGPAEAANEDVLPDQPTPTSLRTLSDGSQHRIVKVFHDAENLAAGLAAAGWTADFRPVETFLVGVAQFSG